MDLELQQTFSKQFLVKGWGLKEQQTIMGLNIRAPRDWSLFRRYLCSLGVEKLACGEDARVDIECTSLGTNQGKSSYYINHQESAAELEVSLGSEKGIYCTWKFCKLGESKTDCVLQMAYFSALTNAVKLGHVV